MKIFSSLIATALLLSTTRAYAEPSPADLQNARTFFKQGEALRASGDLRGALEALRKAHDLAHTPITGVELGTVDEQLGRLVEARDAWREVSRMPALPNESAATRHARADVAARLGPLEARIPVVRIELEGPVKTLAIDGAPVTLESARGRLALDPGAHTILASSDETSRTARIELAEGVELHVSLDVSPTAPPPPADVVRAPAAVPPTPPEAVPGRALLWTSLGVTTVGLAVGGITGGLALSKKGDVANECPDKRCLPSSQSDIDASKTYGTISTIAFIVAGAGAAVALVSYLTHRSPPPDVTMRGFRVSF